MVRHPKTKAELRKEGLSNEAIRWRTSAGALQRPFHGVYIEGAEPPTALETALALVVVTGGTASHFLAGQLHELDSIRLGRPMLTVPRPTRIASRASVVRDLSPERITSTDGYQCTNGTQTMVNLAEVVDDIVWEQALESALRKQLTTIEQIEAAMPELRRARAKGVNRVRRVLALRPAGAPPTESLLETLAIQLIRTDPRLPTPSRQVEVCDRWGQFIARVDLAYPEQQVFLELDGGQHLGQPQYDATRQTAVVVAKKWMPARFTWGDITRNQRQTLRRLGELLDPSFNPAKMG